MNSPSLVFLSTFERKTYTWFGGKPRSLENRPDLKRCELRTQLAYISDPGRLHSSSSLQDMPGDSLLVDAVVAGHFYSCYASSVQGLGEVFQLVEPVYMF